MKNLILALLVVLVSTTAQAQKAKEIIKQSIEAIGGKQNFYNKGTVSYNFEYRTPAGKNAITLVGKESYMFDGERSRGVYTTHSLTGANGKVVEGYNGTDAWVTFDGKVSDNKQANGVARFLRKTNYYWFAMFFKLADEGLTHELLSDQTVNGQDYNRVKITFGTNVGDAQDTYIVYVNKKTKMIDQFLFTVIGFGIKDPYLMTFNYETVDGIKIPSKRKYIEADWNGTVKGKEYYFTNWTNIKFGVALDKAIFEKPAH